MADADDSIALAPPPALAHPSEAGHYDGVSARDLMRRLGVPRVAMYSDVASTMDVAHALAASGAPAGTLVLADRQAAGRGRAGRVWVSEAGAGIWLTLIERPEDGRVIEVLALRLGLQAAAILDRYASQKVGLKWPNDLYVGSRKVAGVLIEARWQDGAPTWVAIGLGVNVHVPDAIATEAAALAAGTRRLDVLEDLLPQLRAAAGARGSLTPDECAQFSARDIALGRPCRSPALGRVEGITATGEILISHDGEVRGYRSGSLRLTDEGDAQ